MLIALHILLFFLMTGVSLSLFLVGWRRREWRGGLCAMGFVIFGVAVTALDPLLRNLPDFGLDEPELIPIGISLVLGVACIIRWWGSTRAAFGEVMRNRWFLLLVWGLLSVSVLSNLAKDKHLWGFFAPSPVHRQDLRMLAQGMMVVFGHCLLLHWAILFLRDEWDRIVHRRSPHEHLLKEHPLTKIGQGARRVCYRIGETGFCVKFMRDPSDTRSGRKIGWRFARMLKNGRFDRRLNINCLEAEAMEKYRHAAGPAVAAALPEVVEVVFDERRGYGVLMSYLTNADGSSIDRATSEMARRTDRSFRVSCYYQISTLLGELIACSAPFFEPDNFDAQIQADGSVRVRMIDFEPVDKKFLPIAEWVPLVRRQNLLRKAILHLKGMREKYGIICGA